MTTYLTSYCNKQHRLSDGKPVEHECRIIPPGALKAERSGDCAAAVEILERCPACGLVVPEGHQICDSCGFVFPGVPERLRG